MHKVFIKTDVYLKKKRGLHVKLQSLLNRPTKMDHCGGCVCVCVFGKGLFFFFLSLFFRGVGVKGCSITK